MLDGLAADGIVVVNSSRTPAELADSGLHLRPGQHLVTVPATELSRARLGRPLPNTALLGAVAAVTGVVSRVVAANVGLAEQAHALVIREEEQRHA